MSLKHAGNLNIAVSSGATAVPIDQVRNISNISRGTSGSLIAESAVRRGHCVTYLASANAKRPFASQLNLNISAPRDAEIERLRGIADELDGLLPRLKERQVKTFEDYRQAITEIVRESSVQVAVLAMAASDYGLVAQSGKIDSDSETLALELNKLPKVISEVRRERPDLFVVGFKLLIDKAPDQLIEEAFQIMLRDRLDLVVANVCQGSIDMQKMQTFLLTPERYVIPLDRDSLAAVLISTIEERYSDAYFKTDLKVVRSLPVAEEEMRQFLYHTQRFAQLALFPQYTADSPSDFGFFAARTGAGTLISARGGSKQHATRFDTAIITGVDYEKRTMNVASLGKKASLNGYIAHCALQMRPEINFVVHLHVDLPTKAMQRTQTSPGTIEDLEAVKDLIASGENIIQQPNHGVIILLKEAEELLPLLEQFNSYNAQAHLYDQTYSGFTGRSRIIDLFSETTDSSARILDMAAGTGAVSAALLRRGYRNLTLVDASPLMLCEAKKKLATQISSKDFVVARMDEFETDQKFDRIILRQGINYIAPQDLTETFRHLRGLLVEGGKLIFNSFDADRFAPGLRPAKRVDLPDSVVLTREGNIQMQGKVWHGQMTEIYSKSSSAYSKSYDLNSFYPHKKEAYLAALQAAGFEQIKLVQEGHSLYFIVSC